MTSLANCNDLVGGVAVYLGTLMLSRKMALVAGPLVILVNAIIFLTSTILKR